MSQDTWAIVELMGHVRTAGRLSEEEKFGSKLGRLDIPTTKKCTCENGERGTTHIVTCETCHGSGIVQDWITQYFGGGSVYRISIVTEAVARHVAKETISAPVSPWDFPKALTKHAAVGQGDDDDDFGQDFA